MKTFREFILECELLEGYKDLPVDKMQRSIDKKSKLANSRKNSKDYFGMWNDRKGIPKIASQIKKMKSTLRTHDSLESRFKELENRDKGDKKRRDTFFKTHKQDQDGKYRKIRQ